VTSGPETATSGSLADAFTAIVEAQWGAVYRLLYHVTGNAHDADELSQETFLRAWQRFDSFQPGTNLRSWLLRIATNAAFDLHRKRKRARGAPLLDDVPGREASPGHWLETAEQTALVRAAMQELSATTRAVFHLRATESLSFREIGEAVGVSEEAARWHMHEARRRLIKTVRRSE
jgi:RNA polymerase sigma-70 factor, ECF subfamily